MVAPAYSSRTKVVLDIEKLGSWPPELLFVLERERDVFLHWERHSGRPYSAQYFDPVIGAVTEAHKPLSVTGWNCTRLTAEEIETNRTDGTDLPNASMLESRIGRQLAAGLRSPGIAATLKSRNQASDKNRAGRLWFCIFPPLLAGESGIGRFFRQSGARALYNSHERDPVTSPALRAIGIPALVEATPGFGFQCCAEQ